jgi:hypothetical protein
MSEAIYHRYLVWFETCIEVDAQNAEQAQELASLEFNKKNPDCVEFDVYVEKE